MSITINISPAASPALVSSITGLEPGTKYPIEVVLDLLEKSYVFTGLTPCPKGSIGLIFGYWIITNGYFVKLLDNCESCGQQLIDFDGRANCNHCGAPPDGF